jgi:hypothetical protein
MHRRFLTASACALIIAALPSCGDDAGGNGSGGVAKSSLAEDLTKSADALSAKLGGAQMPAANDPDVRAYDQHAEKALTALGTDALPIRGFDSFTRYCEKAATVIGGYVGAGGAANDPQKMQANVERHLDQMFTPLLFAAHCQAAHMPFLEQTIDPTDQSKAAAFQQVRQGAFSQVAGLIEMASATDLDEARRRRVVDLLARDADEFAIALTKEQRGQLAAMTQELRGTLPQDLGGQVDTIRAAFEKSACGKLCTAA